jgi:hypothetical protein
MLCDGCGERMQRETVVLVTRRRGRTRSVLQPGWYCWVCKTSAHAAGDFLDGETMLRGRTGANIFAGPSRTPSPRDAADRRASPH